MPTTFVLPDIPILLPQDLMNENDDLAQQSKPLKVHSKRSNARSKC